MNEFASITHTAHALPLQQACTSWNLGEFVSYYEKGRFLPDSLSVTSHVSWL